MPTFLLLTHFEIVIVVRLRGWSGWMRCSDLEVAFAFHQFTLGRCGGFWPWASDTRRAERTRLGVLSPTTDFSLNLSQHSCTQVRFRKILFTVLLQLLRATAPAESLAGAQ